MMLIRSQDKKILTRFSSLAVVEDIVRVGSRSNRKISGYNVIAYPLDNEAVVATYSTKEKALKVMDMIEKQYLGFCCNYHAKSGVFQMPADEEVEA